MEFTFYLSTNNMKHAVKGDTKINIIDKLDLQYEEEIARNPYFLKNWLNYLTFKKDFPASVRYLIYERAIKFLPRSYKLWFSYLTERKKRLENSPIFDRKHKILVNTYERSLIHLHKMPRIWMDYCELLMKMKKGTSTRKAFDRALQSLPITQHEYIWSMYIEWIKEFDVSDTAVRVFRRYMMYDPAHREDFVTYLEKIHQYEEAARQLSLCVNDDHYISPSGQTKHQMWMRLCDLCANHPEAVSDSLKVDEIIRSGIIRFSDEVGRLWCRLSDFYIRQGLFEKARDIYEEAINSVVTVRDFTVVFDAYAKFEESVLTARMQALQAREDKDANEGDSGELSDDEDGETTEELANEVELRLARLEYLMEKRPLLLSSVVLRQNPHNVHEWHKRAKLHKNDPQQTLITFMEAIKTVDPMKANGRLSSLWISLAKYYEKNEDLTNARIIFQKATEIPFRNVEELATVWCTWAETELKHENYNEALAVMQQAVTEPALSIKRRKARAKAQGKGGEGDEGSSTVDRLHRNVRVWNFYLDLEESLGTIDTTRTAYDRAMDLKVVTPQMALNYASFLESNNFFEDSFRVYERAVTLFGFPHVKKIWITYLDKFIERYEGNKMERLRDLFEQALGKVPEEDAAEFYIKFAKAEEQYGLARHAMAVYDRATRAVPESRRIDMYRLYIKRVEHHYGITRARPVYERAITELSDHASCLMCLDFADMERKLGEVDRARAILQHGSQFADPRRDKDTGFWRRWKEFEESHGNEDTFREMLRVKRSIETAFSQVNYLASEMIAAEALNAKAPNVDHVIQDERNDANLSGQKRKFVAALSTSTTGGAPGARGAVNAIEAMEEEVSSKRSSLATAVTSRTITSSLSNREEIDIDDDEGADDPTAIVQRPVPAAVFGGLTNSLSTGGVIPHMVKSGGN